MYTFYFLIIQARCFRRWLKNVKKLKYKYDGNESDNWYVFRALQQDMKIETDNAVTIETQNTNIGVLGDFVKGDNEYESEENFDIRKIQNGESLIGKDSEARGQRLDDSESHHTRMKINSLQLAGNETVNAVHLLNADHMTEAKEPIINQGFSSEQFQLQYNTGSLASKHQSNSVLHSKFGMPLINGNKQNTNVVLGNFGKKVTPNKHGENMASADSLGNIALTETAQLLDTVNYGMCLQR